MGDDRSTLPGTVTIRVAMGDEGSGLPGALTLRVAMGDEPHLLKWTSEAGWEISPEELTMHCRAYGAGFLAAEVDGTPVGCALAPLHSDTCGFIGFFVIDEQQRNKHYGQQLLAAVLDRMQMCNKTRNIGLNAGPDVAPFYRKYGFNVESWSVTGYCGDVCVPSLKPDKSTSRVITIKTIDGSNMEDTAEYDESVTSLDRRQFLHLSLGRPKTLGKVATCKGRIVGYGIKSIDLFENSQVIGPLYAESETVAKALLYHLLSSQGRVVEIYAEVPGTLTSGFFTSLKLESISKMRRYYTLYEPQYNMDKIYCLTNADSHPL